MQAELAAKQIGLLHELLPEATRFGVLVNPTNPLVTGPIVTDLEAATSAIGGQIEVYPASTIRDIDTAFGRLVQMRADALLVSPGPLFGNRRSPYRASTRPTCSRSWRFRDPVAEAAGGRAAAQSGRVHVAGGGEAARDVGCHGPRPPVPWPQPPANALDPPGGPRWMTVTAAS